MRSPSPRVAECLLDNDGGEPAAAELLADLGVEEDALAADVDELGEAGDLTVDAHLEAVGIGLA